MGHLRIVLSIILIFGASSMPLAQAELGGYAVVHPDGHVCGVIVATSSDPFGNGGTMPNEYMGCPAGSRIIFQTKADPDTGNVAGYHGSSPGTSVQYDDSTNSFSISNNTPTNSGSSTSPTVPTKVTLIIKDGIATDASGRSFSTGNGVSATTTLSQEQFQQLVTETSRIESAQNQRQLALNQARALAAQTPGIERCVSWSGYLENGQECATATSSDSATVQVKSVSNSLSGNDSQTVLNIGSDSATVTSESITVNVKPLNNYVAPKINSNSVEIAGSASKVSGLAQKIEVDAKTSTDIDKSLRKLESLRTVTASSSIKLPDAKLSKESAVSQTPNVCSISGIQVIRSGKGLCTVSYTITSEAGNTYTTEKTFTFR
ncbi:hypothetical protein MCEMRH37_00078 [Candidatus Nanopelagicaceae bacterium]